LATVPHPLGEFRKRSEVLLVERVLHAEEGVLADEILDEVDLPFPRQGSVLVLIPASSKELRCREVESRGNGESEVRALGGAKLGEESKRLLIFELRDPCTLISTAERIVRELLGEGIPNHAMHGGVGEDVVGRLRGLRDHQVFLDRGASNRVPPATDHVSQWKRHGNLGFSRDPSKQREPRGSRGGLRS